MDGPGVSGNQIESSPRPLTDKVVDMMLFNDSGVQNRNDLALHPLPTYEYHLAKNWCSDMDRFCAQYAAVLVFVGLFHGQLASAGHCDPLLLSDSKNPLSYRERDGRCEGVYIEQVAGTSIVLVSLTAQFHDFDLSRVEALSVSWPVFDAASIRLRAKGTRWRLHYRMDTARPLSEPQFRWPTEMLDALNVEREDIGVVGWVTTELGGSERSVYLPLTIISDAGTKSADGGYRLVVVPSVPLQEIFVSIASADAKGSPLAFVVDSEPLLYGYYPAHRAFEVPLDGFSLPGLYYVELGAVLRGGGSSTLSFLVYHAPG